MEPGGRGHVLVIDDNAENRALARAALEDEDYEVELAVCGEDGLSAFIARRPDCVLLDIRMPGMDGITVCQRMRELPGAAEIPIMFLTAQRDVDTFDRAQHAGGDDYITKPVRPTELVTRVGNAVKHRRMAAERSEMVQQLRRQRDDLMRLQLQKEALTAFLVHDLKNPVNAIELHSQRMLRDPKASDRSRDAALKISDESRALLRMIVNLLDVSRADEGRLKPAALAVDVPKLVTEILATMAVRAQSANVTLVAAIPAALQLHGDLDLVRRVIENLVDNAIRHAPEETAVTISAVAAGHGVEVRIADAGTGVSPEFREAIFERFEQANGVLAGRANRGLGLSFCKLAVESHQGRIWIEDATPGAQFCFWLPDDAASGG
jgi:two-component system, sensor histidine kinase and response regulator